MTQFSPLSASLGGALLGLAALAFLLLNGRLAGISSIISGSFKSLKGAPLWRWCFIAGLVLSPLILSLFTTQSFSKIDASWAVMIAGGFLVGFGAYYGSGCTSGHGICGMGRLSPRSFISTCIFMLVAALTVFFSKYF